MIAAFLVLIACELVGEVARSSLDLPIPGPVIGMFLLAGILAVRKEKPGTQAIPEVLGRTADGLIRHMGLLFVPAGVGIVAEAGLLRKEWLPIAAGLIGSTVLSLVVTGLVMHWIARDPQQTRPAVDSTNGGSVAASGSVS